jgi:hypothetical protein
MGKMRGEIKHSCWPTEERLFPTGGMQGHPILDHEQTEYDNPKPQPLKEKFHTRFVNKLCQIPDGSFVVSTKGNMLAATDGDIMYIYTARRGLSMKTLLLYLLVGLVVYWAFFL